MEFETIKTKLYRIDAEFMFDLARCHDVYRLACLIDRQKKQLALLLTDATELVQELERGRDASGQNVL